MPGFQPDREAVGTIIDTHYHPGVMRQPRQAAEFFLKLATDIELLSPDPAIDEATLATLGGEFSFTLSNHPLAIPMRPDIEVVHEVSYISAERRIADQPGFAEYDTIAAYLGSTGPISPEPDLKLRYWQVDRRISVSHDGELIMPVETEMAVDALGDPSLTPDDRAGMLLDAMQRGRERRTPQYQMGCFIDMVLLLTIPPVK